MREVFLKRLDGLTAEGPQLLLRKQQYTGWLEDDSGGQAWLTSAVNVVRALCPRGSIFVSEVDELIERQRKQSGIEPVAIRKMLGVLQSVKNDVEAGLVQRIEDTAFAAAFDDFLDHAADYHKGGKIKEAAVLVSVVLEDALKRIAAKHELQSGRSLEPIIEDLVRIGVLTSVKAKRLKSYTAVRNAALHAEWDKLDLSDIGQAISGVRELLDQQLSA